MSFVVKCKCGATMPPERLVGIRLDEIPKECDECAARRSKTKEQSKQPDRE